MARDSLGPPSIIMKPNPATTAALISGGGIGIGRATALVLGRAGYHVVVTDVLEAEGRNAAEAVIQAGGSAEYRFLDVRDGPQTEALVQEIEASGVPLEVLVCNAGIARRVPLEELDDARWHETLEINLGGVFRLMRAAAPGMRTRGRGSMVAVSSIMGVAYGWQRHAHYSASKAGIVGLIRALAVELASDGVRVNGVAPGVIRTAQSLDAINSAGPEGLEQSAGVVPLGRVGEPEDVADVVEFLVSEAARYMTGQVLVVDGGLLVTSPI